MVDLKSQINQEVQLYVKFCRAAAMHDADEAYYRMAAHAVFCHIQEMRATGQLTTLGLAEPIS